MTSFEQARLNFEDYYDDEKSDHRKIIDDPKESNVLLGLLIFRSIDGQSTLFEDCFYNQD
jgi:hypothetical protein